MAKDEESRRHSKALEPEVVSDPVARAEAKSFNGLRQADAVIAAAQEAIERGAFRLRVSLILALHREALRGISSYAGNFRPGAVRIENSRHQPPDAHLVAEFVEDMCDYVNDNWRTKSALHLAAYVMWRLNWIHPFADGNGRTSRAVSHYVLCVRSGYIPPGELTIPDQIIRDRTNYFAALDAADDAWRTLKIVDVSKMEELLGAMLARQLTSYFQSASAKHDLGK